MIVMGVGGGGIGVWSAGSGGRGRGMGWDGMTGRVSISPGGYWIPYVEVFAALIAVVPSLSRRVSERPRQALFARRVRRKKRQQNKTTNGVRACA
jgi:hypothetical protein